MIKTKTEIVRSTTNEGDKAKIEHFIFRDEDFAEDVIYIKRLTLITSIQRKTEYENLGHQCIKSLKNLHLMQKIISFKISTFEKIVNSYF